MAKSKTRNLYVPMDGFDGILLKGSYIYPDMKFSIKEIKPGSCGVFFIYTNKRKAEKAHPGKEIITIVETITKKG